MLCWASPLPLGLVLGNFQCLLGQRVSLIADRPEFRGEGAHRVWIVAGGHLVRISAVSRTNCGTLERWRLAASRISFIPSREKLVVVRVMGTAKS